MATLLKRDITRETYGVKDHKGSKVLVTLKAGDMLEFRVKGKRIKYEVPLETCMRLAFIQFMEDQYKKKVIEYKKKKSIGQKTKRPKAPPRIFSEKFYKALKFV